jgi:predicted nucleotide-binding protein
MEAMSELSGTAIEDTVRPNVFIVGSSTPEGRSSMETVARWLESAGADPQPWTEVFPTGKTIFDRLIDIGQKVHGAVIVLTPDDIVTSESGERRAPRGNVLIELGLFVGALGAKKAVVCISGKPVIPADLQGLVWIGLEDLEAEKRLAYWANDIKRELIEADIITPEEAARIARLWRSDNMREDLIASRLHRLGYSDFVPIE